MPTETVMYVLFSGLIIAALAFVYLAKKFNTVIKALDDMSTHNQALMVAKEELQTELRISRAQEIALQKTLQDYKISVPSYTDREVICDDCLEDIKMGRQEVE